MILRISSAIVSENQVGTYLEHVGKNVMPAYQTAVGLISVSLLRRQVVGIVEFLFLSIWQSNEALKRFLVPKALLAAEVLCVSPPGDGASPAHGMYS